MMIRPVKRLVEVAIYESMLSVLDRDYFTPEASQQLAGG